MNARGWLSSSPDRGLPPTLPRIAGGAISTKLQYCSGRVFSGTPVTFLSRHTYPAIEITVEGALLCCSRDSGKQETRIAAGEGNKNE